LKFDRVNLIKNELTLRKTDWSVFFDKTDKWRIDYNLTNENSIDQCIIKLQKLLKPINNSPPLHSVKGTH